MNPDPSPRVSARKYQGLGDVAAAIANPIARGLDAVFHTDLVNCPGCEQRRKDWNEAVPLNQGRYQSRPE